jgi:Bacterial Ig domain
MRTWRRRKPAALRSPSRTAPTAAVSSVPALADPARAAPPPASAPDDETVEVKAVKRGTAEISLSQVSTTNTGSGTFDYGPARFKVTVNNVAPTISDVANQSTNEDNPTGTVSFTVGDAGTAAGDLTMSGSSSNTTLVPNANIAFDGSGASRTVTVTPAPNKSGTATITLSVSDGAATTTDTFVLTVNATNDQPDAADDITAANEGGSNVTVGVLANDEDIDGDALTITGNTQPPSGEGSVTCSAASCAFAPDADFHGTTEFTYNVSDGNGGTDSATVTANVAATNDAPEANNDSYGVDEDGTLNVGAPGILADDTDLDDLLGPVTALTAALVNGPDDGTLALNANGSFTYAPDANFNGTDSFTYRVNDGAVNGSIATVVINVSPVNDVPTVTLNGDAQDAKEGQTKTYHFTVVDPDSGAFDVKGGFPDCGSGAAYVADSLDTTVSGGSFQCRFLDGPASPIVRVQVSDLQGQVSNIATRTVTVANVAPRISLSGPSTVRMGQVATYRFTAISAPGADISAFAAGYPSCGTGAVLVGTPSIGAGSFACSFVKGPVRTTVAVRVDDLDGGLSNVASRTVNVAEAKKK